MKKIKKYAFVTERDGVTYWRDMNNPTDEIKKEKKGKEVVTSCKIKSEKKLWLIK